MGAQYYRNKWQPIEKLHVLGVDGAVAPAITLSKPVSNCVDMVVEKDGNILLLADINQIYRFDAAGKLISVLGGGTFKRTESGSELRHTLALDSAGNIYAHAFGKIARFDPAWSMVGTRAAEYYWYDPWSPHDSYVAYAIDNQNRFWVATTGKSDGVGRYHLRPCISRVKTNYFEKLKVATTKQLGLDAQASVTLPYNIAYDFSPIPIEFQVKPGYRRVKDVTVKWHVYDVLKSPGASGKFDLTLEDGVGVTNSVSFTPPAWGWYTAEFQIFEREELLMGVTTHIGVTPKFPGMPTLAAGESPGGWRDIPRLAFCGLKSHRIDTRLKPEEISQQIDLAEKYGVTLLVQFESAKDCEPDKVRAVVTRHKGRVKYWEVVNEPNFTLSPEKYVALLKETYAIIKEIDPAAQVLAPAVCGVQLPWHQKFYELGGKNYFDILSVHDYEGNESIDPGHWVWKFGELRKLMAANGDAGKAIWQTERAIGGVRGNIFLGGAQAVRVTLQRDVLEVLGIPNEHNLHYYLNQGGYSDVPTYLWSAAGPHPGALACRTREAMTRGHKFAGAVDFGPTGNKLFMGLRFDGPESSVLVLRNLGMLSLPHGIAGGGNRCTGGDRQLWQRDEGGGPRWTGDDRGSDPAGVPSRSQSGQDYYSETGLGRKPCRAGEV